MSHFEDKILTCSFCQKHIHIKHNQVGGAWHLRNYEGKDGEVHNGVACPKCFDAMTREV